MIKLKLWFISCRKIKVYVWSLLIVLCHLVLKATSWSLTETSYSLTVLQMQILSWWALCILWLRDSLLLLAANWGQENYFPTCFSIKMTNLSKMIPEESWISLQCQSQTKVSTSVNTQEKNQHRVGCQFRVSRIKTIHTFSFL